MVFLRGVGWVGLELAKVWATGVLLRNPSLQLLNQH